MAEPKHDVLNAAVQLFQVSGLNATTIEDITKSAGIAKGAFYRHFDSKETLIVELIERFSDDIFKKAAALPQRELPLSGLRKMIAAELEVAANYESFLYAASMDFPPSSAGPVPEAFDSLRKQLYVWHKHILLDAFGNRINPYVEDLVSVFEGAINSYLMRMFWQEVPAMPGQIARFITQCLEAIVFSDENLTPAMHPGGEKTLDQQSLLQRIAAELTAIRSTIKRVPGDDLTLAHDLQSLDLVIEELQQHEPRAFLIDALLAQLHGREHLTKYLESTLAHWNDWKGATL